LIQRFFQRLQQREDAPVWSLTIALVFAAAYTVSWVAGQLLIATLSNSDFAAPTPGILMFGALFGCVVTILVVSQWARRRMGDETPDNLRLKAPISPPIFVVVLVGLGAAWAIDLIGVLLRLRGDQVLPPVLEAIREPIGLAWIAAALLAVVFQPIAEGLVFGGLLYPALTRSMSNIVAAILTAVIYTIASLAVLSTGAGIWYALIQPFLMMLVVAIIRAYTKSTQSAIIGRALFGLFFILAGLIIR